MKERYQKLSRPNKWWLMLPLLAVVLGGLWFVVERVINVDRYKPQALAAIQEATGLPAKIDDLDLVLLPFPRLVVRGISVGEGDLRLEATDVVVTAEYWGILRRQVNVTSVSVSDPLIVIPDDLSDATARIKGLFESRPSAKQGDGQGFRVTVGNIHVNNARLLRSGSDSPLMVLDGTLDDFSGESIHGTVEADVPALGKDCRIACDATVSRGERAQFSGKVDVKGLNVKRLVADLWVEDAEIDLSADVQTDETGRIKSVVSGVTRSASKSVLDGNVEAVAWWDGTALDVNDIVWAAKGISSKGDATWDPKAGLAWHVVEARSGVDGFALIPPISKTPLLRLAGNDEAEMTVSELVAGVDKDGHLRLAEGKVGFKGLSLVDEAGKKRIPDASGKISIAEGRFRIDEFAAGGMSLAGEVVPDLGKQTFSVDVSGHTDLGLPVFASFLPKTPITEMKGPVTIRRFSVTLPGEQMPPADLSVSCTLEGCRVAIKIPDSDEPLRLEDVKGDMEWREGALVLTNLSSGGMLVSGSIKPNSDKTVGLNLTGSVDVEQVSVLTDSLKAYAQGLGGTIRIEKLTGTWSESSPLPPDLVLQCSLEKGRVRSVLPAFPAEIVSLTGKLGVQSGEVDLQCTGESLELGSLGMSARHKLKSSVFEGTMDCDVSRVGSKLLGSGISENAFAQAVLSVYGRSSLGIRAELTGSPATIASLNVNRSTDPQFEGRVVMAKNETGWQASAFETSAVLPSDGFQSFLPANVISTGPLRLTYREDAAAATMAGTADLTACGLRVGSRLEKRAGDALTVDVTGTRTGAARAFQTGNVAFRDAKVPFRIEGSRIATKPFELQLASLAALFPDGTAVQGLLRGTVELNPASASLLFENAAFSFGPGLSVDWVNGDIAYSDGQWSCKNLALRGFNSDVSLSAVRGSNGWHGTLSGAALDVNTILAVKADLAPADTSASEPAESRPGSTGELNVAVQSLMFRRARFEEVRGNVLFAEDGVHIREFSCRPYTGSAAGTIEYLKAPVPNTNLLRLNLNLRDADARAIDEIVFAESRDFAGTVSGVATLDLPLGTGRPALSGANGEIAYDAVKGSFGKMGAASKLLTLLRTTQVFRFRPPPTKDEGLAYDKCSAKYTIRDGVMTIDNMALESPGYEMHVSGGIDFNQSLSDMVVYVRPLAGVSGIMDAVPIIGQVTSNVTGVRFRIQGSPYDPTVGLESVVKAEGATKKAEDSAVSIIQGTIGELLKR